MKYNMTKKILFTTLLGASFGFSFSQTQMAIWDFSTLSNASTSSINATTEVLNGTPSLQQYNQLIDDNGKGGTSYTDIASVSHSAGSAIAWDDIRGSGTDAALEITMNTTGFQNIFLRFDYKSESATAFDLVYSIDNGSTFTLLLDDVTIISDGFTSFSSITNDLSSFSAIENQSNIIFKIYEMNITGNDKFAFDNIEFYASTGGGGGSSTPSIQNNITTTRFVNINATGGSASAVISDPTDPCRTKGINFYLQDNDTPLNTLTVTATSSNTSVVSNANLVITMSNDSIRNLKITPTGVGYTNITVTVTDGTTTDTYVLNYASSAAAYSIPNTDFHTGIADASTCIDVGNNYIIGADDEANSVKLYHKDSSGYILNSYDIGTPMGITEEGDFEASVVKGSRAYWISSLGNSASGNIKPSRHRFFATDIAGSGSSTTLSYVGSYSMRSSVISWGDSHSYDFSSSAANGMIPKQIDGFNVEGLCLGVNNTTLYIAFRAPLVPISNRTKALICPVTNFETWFNNGSPSGSPNFGNPIELDLGGRGIRSIEQNANGQFLIVAGSYDSNHNPALYEWNGNALSAPVLLTADLTGLNPEGIVSFPSPFYNGSVVELMSDDGTEIPYNDGIENKLLANPNYRKYRTVKIATTGGTLSGCVNATLSSATVSQTTVCEGSATTITINGNLNNETGWHVYTGSCGGVAVTNTASSTITVNPTATTTYYIRGEGGCPSPGACASITINVNALPNVTLNVAAIDTHCVNLGAVILSGGIPSGGVYSGVGVSLGNFSPATAGLGSHVITYTYTDGNSCVDAANSVMVVSGCLGITESTMDNGLLIYPNPINNIFIIQGNSIANSTMKIYNALGQEVYGQQLTADKEEVDISILENGMYFIQIQNAKKMLNKKLIKY